MSSQVAMSHLSTVVLMEWLQENYDSVENEDDDELIVFWMLSQTCSWARQYSRNFPRMIGNAHMNYLFSLEDCRLYYNPTLYDYDNNEVNFAAFWSRVRF